MKDIPLFSSIQLLKKALAEHGYTNNTLVLGEDNYTQFTAPSGAVWLTSNTHINYPFVSSTVRTISDKKHLAYELARSLGARTPWTKLITEPEVSSLEIASLLKHAPLVVKPNDSSLSKGLTINIGTREILLNAIAEALKISDNVLIQEQIKGQEIRFTALNGKLVAAILRETPRVIGDGKTTVRGLLHLENKSRNKIKVPFLTYPQLDKPIIDLSAADLDYIPGNDEVVELSRSTMIRGGASVYNVIDDIHESYKKTALTLATTLGHGFVVVDMFIEDFQQPQNGANYAFIEYNMSPVLKLFYSCRDGKHYDVLPDLALMIDGVVA